MFSKSCTLFFNTSIILSVLDDGGAWGGGDTSKKKGYNLKKKIKKHWWLTIKNLRLLQIYVVFPQGRIQVGQDAMTPSEDLREVPEGGHFLAVWLPK